ncbi:hypothetical protein L3049_08305 [Labilibaculum sp. DW002]|uniref:Uncharacterized protein n=1 Tax=Paralabilibaculum antarcticum TaxID=2912572 RepID=A0ABT5VRF3_9BACT|nr:hypothetical protein [Labilibaculum sp. DW002]MDE5418008.1 hypothetical protein [Labilibaculum sp. DW002]
MNIAEIISSLSLLIVFVTVLFSYFVTKADELLDFKLSTISTNEDKLKKQRKKVRNFIWFNWVFPILLINISSFWILIPTVMEIFETYDFAPLDFEIKPTIFVFIAIYLFIFIILSVIKLIKLFGVNNEINKSINKL